MGLTERLAAFGGDIWVSSRCAALWPWPAVVVGAVHSRIGWDDLRLFEAILRPGDLLLTRTNRYKASNRAIPGAFKHLGVYVGPVHGRLDRHAHTISKPRGLGLGYIPSAHPKPDIHPHAVVHAISEGVVAQDLGDVMMHADYVAAVRPARNSSHQTRMVETALASVGLGYNFDFKPTGPEALYCTELGVCAARSADLPVPALSRIHVSIPGIILRLDRLRAEVTLADSFLCYPMVACSVSTSEPSFQRKSLLGDIMRKAIAACPDATEPSL